MKKNLVQRKQLIELFEQGVRTCEIARRVGISRNVVSELRSLYSLYGAEELLRDRSYHPVSKETKRASVMEHLEKGVSLRKLSVKYNVSQKGIQKWINQVVAGGYDALTDSRYGRPKDMSGTKKERPVPLEVLEENRRLKQELEWLRTENALLKKVKALVEARDARLKGIGPKPSKD